MIITAASVIKVSPSGVTLISLILLTGVCVKN